MPESRHGRRVAPKTRTRPGIVGQFFFLCVSKKDLALSFFICDKRIMSNATTDDKFRTALNAAAAKAGIDVSAVEWTTCTTDATWGDRVGQVFFGSDDVTNERAARFFHAWIRKNSPSGNYDAQSSICFDGKFHYSRFSNGCEGWHKGPANEYEPQMLRSGDWSFLLERVEVKHGFAVSTTYYPGAD